MSMRKRGRSVFPIALGLTPLAAWAQGDGTFVAPTQVPLGRAAGIVAGQFRARSPSACGSAGAQEAGQLSAAHPWRHEIVP